MTTPQAWASGSWHVRPDRVDEFVRRWTAFLDWTNAAYPGLRWARLLRDADDGDHFRSFAAWDRRDEVDRWQQDPDFASHLEACLAVCDDFRGGTYLEEASVS